MDLQELIARGRFIFSGAPERLARFHLVDGRQNAQQLAKRTRHHVNNVRRDLTKMRDAGLIQAKLDRNGSEQQLSGFPVYEKVPLARAVPARYFLGGPISAPRPFSDRIQHARRGGERRKPLPIPTEQQILDICKSGEDQTYEFKAAGTDARKISREVGAMLNTKSGGIIFYGIDDDGTIAGTDVTRQKLDQPLQNSIKNSISPAATITLRSVSVIGTEVLVIVVPPWDRKNVFQSDERVLIRKGTNVFAAKPEELKKLHQGKPVV
jgi:predicted HTH transcriptional regulator